MKKDFRGAIAVLENFLDGAVADYENKDIEDSETIWSCISAIKELGGLFYQDYIDRMEKCMKEENEQ